MYSSMVHHQPQLTTNNSCHHRARALLRPCVPCVACLAHHGVPCASTCVSCVIACTDLMEATHPHDFQYGCMFSLIFVHLAFYSLPHPARLVHPLTSVLSHPSPLLLFYYSKPEEVLKEMPKGKPKFYAVSCGSTPGIYASWYFTQTHHKPNTLCAPSFEGSNCPQGRSVVLM